MYITTLIYILAEKMFRHFLIQNGQNGYFNFQITQKLEN